MLPDDPESVSGSGRVLRPTLWYGMSEVEAVGCLGSGSLFESEYSPTPKVPFRQEGMVSVRYVTFEEKRRRWGS